jgi:hypothetical protein
MKYEAIGELLELGRCDKVRVHWALKQLRAEYRIVGGGAGAGEPLDLAAEEGLP